MKASGDTLLVLDQIAQQHEYWVDVATRALSNTSTDLAWSENPEAFRSIAAAIETAGVTGSVPSAIEEIMRGLIHSLLVTIDGGTELAAKVELALTANGEELPSHLHELWIGHLFETGRLK